MCFKLALKQIQAVASRTAAGRLFRTTGLVTEKTVSPDFCERCHNCCSAALLRTETALCWWALFVLFRHAVDLPRWRSDRRAVIGWYVTNLFKRTCTGCCRVYRATMLRPSLDLIRHLRKTLLLVWLPGLCWPSLLTLDINPLTPTVDIWVYKAFICNFWHPATLMLRAERQSSQMSKITNDGLTLSSRGCFTAVPIWQQWASKG